MSTGYTDEELAEGVKWDPMLHGLQGLNDLAFRLGATIARLQRERDAALARVKELELERGAWERSARLIADKHLETGDMFRVQRDDARKALATVRRETVEECAKVVERFDEQATNEQFKASRRHMARRIRALLDEPKDDYPTLDPVTTAPAPRRRIDTTRGPRQPQAEAKCRVCGDPEDFHEDDGTDHPGNNGHDFEPEPCCGEFGTGSGEHSEECDQHPDLEPEEPGHG